MIPDGWYLMRPIHEKREFGKSGQSATTQQVAIPMVVTENGQFKGQVIMWTGTFKEGDSIRITLDSLRTMGWDGSAPIADLRGVGTKDVSCRVETDRKYGPKVQAVKEPGKVFWQGGVMNKEELSGLDAMVAGAKADTRQPGPRAPKTQGQKPSYAGGGQDWDGQGAPPGGSGNSDDEIPFASCDMSSEPSLKFMRHVRV